MRLRPVDASGDILPVLCSDDLLTDAEAIARLAEARLWVFIEDWWENPGSGNPALEMLRDNRLTEADGDAIAQALSDYILQTPGVLSVAEPTVTFTDRQVNFSCRLQTYYGETGLQYSLVP